MKNRLAGSTSPYLRQHADDLVEWQPWDEEAFELARDLGRPVLLSCGYSACHWCHVMQRESFKDPATAALLNDGFVSIKVDRETRPDIDALYQDYIAATAGAGGWPLTVVLTADKRPVIGGTYFPKVAQGGTPSFVDVLTTVQDIYEDDPAQVEATASSALEYLRAQSAPKPEQSIDRNVLDYAADFVVQIQDQVHGGMKGAPKFPQLPIVEFLTMYHRLVPDTEIELAVELTLTGIVRGGIYDQVGGGVHRYSVDSAWRTPHFEKMLYDQGLLLSALSQAAGMETDEVLISEYAAIARDTAAFLVREMAAPGGGFFASLSADTDGVEGAAYTWTGSQLKAALSREQRAVADAELGTEEADDEEGLTLVRPNGRKHETEAVEEVLQALRRARGTRTRPEADTKVLTAWNAIAARGLMEAGAAFDDQEMTDIGVRTVRGLLDRAVTANGVMRDPGDPASHDLRLIEDAAHLASALITAAEVTGDRSMIEAAADIHADVVTRFAVGNQLYMTPEDTDLPVRAREQGDNACPSGASTAIENAVRLGLASGDETLLGWATDALRQVWSVADFAPEQAGRALAAAVTLELAGRLPKAG